MICVPGEPRSVSHGDDDGKGDEYIVEMLAARADMCGASCLHVRAYVRREMRQRES